MEESNAQTQLDYVNERIAEHHGLSIRSALGPHQCPQCGADPCICREIGDEYTDEEWAELTGGTP